MSRGGARNRSGPRKDPNSERSEKLGVRFGKLPASGFTGRVPRWPLTSASAREREVWKELWRTPQAAAWATEPWRHRAVAMYTRLFVRCEDPESPASLHAQLIRYADQIGLTPAGLRENQWLIEGIEGIVASGVESPVTPGEAADGSKPPVGSGAALPRDRLKVVAGGSA